ncbi:hypothetical protein Rhe02_37290 [Rhizocola hellebori]|uniref:Uncharacterized protein n=1 Tax=Rhizocola hellebori TaxID=1392758 RepID=A0A8J3Q9H1_9ACTN|nr:hypothetical protein [Rhizocola hellebori]GIH05662.1 hypothetical protein Rhe02_37290 [Rhizocola hellebori]
MSGKLRAVVAMCAAAAGWLLPPSTANAGVLAVVTVNTNLPTDWAGCGEGEHAGKWRFYLTGVAGTTGVQPPAKISAKVQSAGPVDIALTLADDATHTAFYELASSAKLTGEATAQIDQAWTASANNFGLGNGPCEPTRVTMTATAPIVVFGTTFTVAGRLTTAAGVPLADKASQFRLHSIDADGKGREFTGLHTDSDGRFTTAVTAESFGPLYLTGEFYGEPPTGSAHTASAATIVVWSVPAAPAAASGALVSSAGSSIGSGARKTVVSGAGFAPSADVAISVYSTPQLLGTTVCDESGAFSVEVTIPADLSGNHQLVASGIAADHESVRYLELPITVAGSGQGGGLPLTGDNVWALMALGVLLSAAGAALVFWAGLRPRASGV